MLPGLLSARGGGDKSGTPPRPRIYVYDLPPEVLSTVGNLGDRMVEQIKSGPFHELDPEKADYFWIPGGGHYPGKEGSPEGQLARQRAFVTAIFEYVRSHHPWWNRTVAQGHARWDAAVQTTLPQPVVMDVDQPTLSL